MHTFWERLSILPSSVQEKVVQQLPRRVKSAVRTACKQGRALIDSSVTSLRVGTLWDHWLNNPPWSVKLPGIKRLMFTCVVTDIQVKLLATRHGDMLGGLDKLTLQHISTRPRLSLDSLQAICRACSSATQLQLPEGSVEQWGAEALAALASMPRLQVLTLDWNMWNRTAPGCVHRQVHDSDMALLSRASQLTRLELSGGEKVAVSDAQLHVLSMLHTLSDLSLTYFPSLSGEGLTTCSSLHRLTALNLGNCRNITCGGLVALAGLRSLRQLNLSACFGEAMPTHSTASARDLTLLTQLTGLQRLELASNCLVPDGLAAVAAVQSITRLNLSSSIIDAWPCCSSLVNLCSLGAVNLMERLPTNHHGSAVDAHFEIGPRQAQVLAAMPKLQHLELDFGDLCMPFHTPLTAVTHLVLWAVEDGGLEQLHDAFPAVAELQLECCVGLTDEGLQELGSSCTGIRRLSLAECEETTEAGFAALSGIQALRELHLRCCAHIPPSAVQAAVCGAEPERVAVTSSAWAGGVHMFMSDMDEQDEALEAAENVAMVLEEDSEGGEWVNGEGEGPL